VQDLKERVNRSGSVAFVKACDTVQGDVSALTGGLVTEPNALI